MGNKLQRFPVELFGGLFKNTVKKIKDRKKKTQRPDSYKKKEKK